MHKPGWIWRAMTAKTQVKDLMDGVKTLVEDVRGPVFSAAIFHKVLKTVRARFITAEKATGSGEEMPDAGASRQVLFGALSCLSKMMVDAERPEILHDGRHHSTHEFFDAVDEAQASSKNLWEVCKESTIEDCLHVIGPSTEVLGVLAEKANEFSMETKKNFGRSRRDLGFLLPVSYLQPAIQSHVGSIVMSRAALVLFQAALEAYMLTEVGSLQILTKHRKCKNNKHERHECPRPDDVTTV